MLLFYIYFSVLKLDVLNLPQNDMNMAKKTVPPLSNIRLAIAFEHECWILQYGHWKSHNGHMVKFNFGSQISFLKKITFIQHM